MRSTRKSGISLRCFLKRRYSSRSSTKSWASRVEEAASIRLALPTIKERVEVGMLLVVRLTPREVPT